MSLSVQAEMTVEVVRVRGWQCVLLGPRSKRPTGGESWVTTTDARRVAQWFADAYNVGLCCGSSTIAALDPDDMLEWADAIDTLGPPALPWVKTGSGKLHYYVHWMPELPAKLIWNDTLIGELQRGPNQQVVLPGSLHPSGGEYRWITDRLGLVEPVNPVSDPLPTLPGEWLAHLRSHGYR
jgi:hypothetical protein